LAVELYSELFDELQLRFQKINVMLFVDEEIIIQFLGDAVMNGDAIFRSLRIERPRRNFSGKVATDDFLHRLPDPQRIEHLEIGKAF
jgi:hypothetical protein